MIWTYTRVKVNKKGYTREGLFVGTRTPYYMCEAPGHRMPVQAADRHFLLERLRESDPEARWAPRGGGRPPREGTAGSRHVLYLGPIAATFLATQARKAKMSPSLWLSTHLAYLSQGEHENVDL